MTTENETKKDTRFNFDTVLKPTRNIGSLKFPDDSSIGIKLSEKNDAQGDYSLEIRISEPLANKYKMKIGGQVIAALSACSNAVRIVYNDTKDLDFNGYTLRPLGTYKNAEEKRKMNGKMVAFVFTATIKKDYIDKNKTKPFKTTYVPVLFGKNTQFVVDITELPITVKKSKKK